MTKPDVNQFLSSPVGGDITQASLHDELMAQTQWQGRYRIIMKLGARMPKLDSQWQQESAEVSGCESKAWLYHHQSDDGKHHFLADSESRIIKGLLVLILSACNHKTSQQLTQLELEPWFAELGLSAHLSPSRANGVAALIQKVKSLSFR